MPGTQHRIRTAAWALVALAAFSASCARPPAQPAAVTRDAPNALNEAIQAVRAATAARSEAVEKGDIEAWLDTYTNDAVWMPSQSEEFVGKELARARLKVLLDAVEVREAQQEDEHTLLAPDVLLDRGNYAVEMIPRKGGDSSFDAGTYLTIWRKGKEDNRWRISYQMWTSHRSFQDVAGEAGQGGAK